MPLFYSKFYLRFYFLRVTGKELLGTCEVCEISVKVNTVRCLEPAEIVKIPTFHAKTSLKGMDWDIL